MCSRMQTTARKLAEVFRKASPEGRPENTFRKDVEGYLVSLAAELNIELIPRTEVTLGTSGRADTIYNRFIIEWEKPGSPTRVPDRASCSSFSQRRCKSRKSVCTWSKSRQARTRSGGNRPPPCWRR